MELFKINTPHLTKVIKVLVDGCCTGEKFAKAVEDILNAEVEVAKRNELHTFVVIPKRWVVERTFGWLDKYLRLWKKALEKRYADYDLLFLHSRVFTFTMNLYVRRFKGILFVLLIMFFS